MSGSYLPSTGYLAPPSPHPESAEARAHPDLPPEYTPDMLEAFKHDVRIWLELDTSIRVLQANLRERRAEKTLLTQRMLEFMRRYQIDDLNTPMGRLRFQVSKVKAPLSQRSIVDRITRYYSDDVVASQQLRAAVFGNREVSSRASIRRIAER